MEHKSNTPGRNRRKKMERMKKIEDTLRPITMGSPKNAFFTLDVIVKLFRETPDGRREINRALRSYAFDNREDSRAYIEKVSRRKFCCDHTENIDFARPDHFLNYFLDEFARYIQGSLKSPYRPVFAACLPDILAVLLPEERDAVTQKTALLFYERSRRENNKRAEKEMSETPIVHEIQQTDMVTATQDSQGIQMPKIILKTEPALSSESELPKIIETTVIEEVIDNSKGLDMSRILNNEDSSILELDRISPQDQPQELLKNTEMLRIITNTPQKVDFSKIYTPEEFAKIDAKIEARLRQQSVPPNSPTTTDTDN